MTPRALVRFDKGGYASYDVDESVGVGDRVTCPWGNYNSETRQGTVELLYPAGPNSHLRIERCECGTAIFRLQDGSIQQAYFGECKRARKA